MREEPAAHNRDTGRRRASGTGGHTPRGTERRGGRGRPRDAEPRGGRPGADRRAPSHATTRSTGGARRVLLILLFIVIAIAVVAVIANAVSCSSGGQGDGIDAGDGIHDEQIVAKVGSVSTSDISNIPDSTSPLIFSLSTGSKVSETTLPYFESLAGRTSVFDKILPYENQGVPMGFLIVDCETGNSMSCNIDEEIYGASTFKALYAFYVCEAFVETGACSLDDRFDLYVESDYDGYYRKGEASLEDLISNSLVYSDNGSYGSLREAFDGEAFEEWLASHDASVYSPEDSWFPTYSVRNGAKLWLGLYAYLRSGTETATWLESVLTNTDTSFFRDTLGDYDGLSILDKAGWYAGDEDTGGAYDCVSDLGIVTYDDRDYLFCIMTGAAYDDDTVYDLESLVSTVFAAFVNVEQAM